MSNILNCPVTGQKILSIGPRGVMKRENYAEIFFILSDGSRMRVAVSKAAKRQFKQADANKIFQQISKDWQNNIKTKVIDKARKDKQIARVQKLSFVAVEDRGGVLIGKEAVKAARSEKLKA